jgi:GDP-L-fucose synthase
MRKIAITGATGFLGKRVVRKLRQRGYPFVPTSLRLGVDLRDYDQAAAFFQREKPDIVLNCAAFVGGIQFGYKYPAELFENNLLMNVNLLRAAREAGVRRIVNPISNCVYPAKAILFREAEIWDGPMHESVMVYGFVRKAFWMGAWANHQQYGLDTVNIVLSNMYGPEDHFEEERSHALGALIMKFVEAKRAEDPEVVVWGTGQPVREWLHVDDGAEALLRAIDIAPTTEFINVGWGYGISICQLAELIRDLVGYTGAIYFDTSKPDGAPYKTVDGRRGEALLGWKPSILLQEGVAATVRWYEAHYQTSNLLLC